MPKCDLRNCDFTGYKLVSVDFSGSSFVRSVFNSVDFDWLAGHPFQPRSNLSNCDFRSAKFAGTRFGCTATIGSDFSRAELNGANVSKANFSRANFYKAMVAAEFHDTDLTDVNFEGSYIMGGTFTNVDLSKTLGLGRAHYYPPVTIDARSLIRSGTLPKALYRACGLPDKMSSGLQRILHSGIKRI